MDVGHVEWLGLFYATNSTSTLWAGSFWNKAFKGSFCSSEVSEVEDQLCLEEV